MSEVVAQEAVVGRSFAATLRRTLVGADEGRWLATVVLAAATGWALGMAVAQSVLVMFGEAGATGFSGWIDKLDTGTIWLALALAPLHESAILLLLVWATGFWWRWPPVASVAAVSVLMTALHGLSPLSLAVLPGFVLMAAIQYSWSARRRPWLGLLVVGATHVLLNLATVAWVWFTSGGAAGSAT